MEGEGAGQGGQSNLSMRGEVHRREFRDLPAVRGTLTFYLETM